LEEAKQKGYSTAFIVAYKDGIKINVTDAIK
jgi:N-acetylmuramoyl-L-alanine amidase